MEQKTKFIILGLAGFSVICLFLFFQAFSQQQTLARESNDLKSENATLLSKVSQLERDLKENQGKIDSLKTERDKAVGELGELQSKLDAATKARDELTEKLKKQSQRQETAVSQSQFAPENTDAYWGAILKAKTDLEMQLASIRVELKSLQISNESLQREKSSLQIDINNLFNEKQDLTRQLDYNQKILDSISQEVVRERNDKVKIQENFKKVKGENTSISRQLKSLIGRKEALDRKVQDLHTEKSTIEKRLNEMEIMLTERISQIDALKNQLDSIRSGKLTATSEAKSRESVELPAIVVRSTVSPENAKPLKPAFSGKILAVNPDSNFVIIDIGISSGVKVGDSFDVYRQEKSIGSIVVIQARESIAACDIKRMITPLKIGDSIK